jgi:spore maturation protein A
MNVLWLLMVCVSIVFAIATGHLEAFTTAIFDGAKSAVEVSFKNIPGDHPSITAITLNLLANLFGLGNAATPLGIQAMQDLDLLNAEKGTITPEMMTFIVLNTASIQLIPFSVIGILASYGDSNPAAVVLPVLIATAISAMTALLVLALFRRIFRGVR